MKVEIITSAVGVAALILGVYLRPIIEEWFSNRQKTLEITASDNVVEIPIPDGEFTVDWHGAPIDRIVKADFRLANRTGRTLRNFALEIGPSIPPQPNNRFETYVQMDERARFIKSDGHNCRIYKFEFVEPKVVLHGFLLSNYSRRVKFCALGDVELRRRDPAGRRDVTDMWSNVAALAAIASLIVAIAALIWS